MASKLPRVTPFPRRLSSGSSFEPNRPPGSRHSQLPRPVRPSAAVCPREVPRPCGSACRAPARPAPRRRRAAAPGLWALQAGQSHPAAAYVMPAAPGLYLVATSISKMPPFDATRGQSEGIFSRNTTGSGCAPRENAEVVGEGRAKVRPFRDPVLKYYTIILQHVRSNSRELGRCEVVEDGPHCHGAHADVRGPGGGIGRRRVATNASPHRGVSPVEEAPFLSRVAVSNT